MATMAMQLAQKLCILLDLDPGKVSELQITVNPQDVVRVHVEMLPTTDVEFDNLVVELVKLEVDHVASA